MVLKGSCSRRKWRLMYIFCIGLLTVLREEVDWIFALSYFLSICACFLRC